MCDICKTIEKSLNGENPFFVKELETGIVVLGWNQHFYGYTIFMCKRHATELYQLDDEFCSKYMQEMVKVAKAVSRAFDCEKIWIYFGRGFNNVGGNRIGCVNYHSCFAKKYSGF